jgi:16S rRNA processing protein RimM
MNKPEPTLESASENPPSEPWLEVGTIVAPQGLQGEIRVYPQSDFPERFQKPGQRWLQRSGQEPFSVNLVRGRYVPGKDLYIITLEGITSCEAVDALRGCKLVVPQNDRPQLPPDQFHVLDLIGLGVYHQKTGVAIGTVVDIIPAGNDLLEVELAEQPPQPVIPEKVTPNRKSKIPKPKRQTAPQPVTILIPFVYEIVPIVDLLQQRLEINPPEGLLEINLSPDLSASDKPQ